MCILAGNKAIMGNQHPVCPGIASVTVYTYSFCFMMGLIALQASGFVCQGNRAEQDEDPRKEAQKLQTKAQFSPRKNAATTVKARIPTKAINVRMLTTHWSLGSHPAP
jgi:hypothetical protein